MVKTEERPATEGMNFRSIQDTRLKTLRIAVSFMLPLGKEMAATNTLLPSLLNRISREYPDSTRSNERLSKLYGAAIHADVRKLGEAQVFSAAAVGLADRYALEGEGIPAELSHLLHSILLDPPFMDGLSPGDDFEREKKQTIEMVDPDSNDKRTLAHLRCEQLMCDHEAFRIDCYGSREDATALRREEVTRVWERMLRTTRIEIMALGDCDPVPIYGSFLGVFKGLDRDPVPEPHTGIIKEVTKPREFSSMTEVTQSELVSGLRVGAVIPQGAATSVKLMSAILGDTPSSKLFLNVREKLSLRYYYVSYYDWGKDIILVESSVETENIDRTQTEILGQLDEIRAGKVTEEEPLAARLSVGNGYRTVGDYLGSLESWYVFQTFCGEIQPPEGVVEEVNFVTIEQVVQVANRAVLDTVYRVVGEGRAEE